MHTLTHVWFADWDKVPKALLFSKLHYYFYQSGVWTARAVNQFAAASSFFYQTKVKFTTLNNCCLFSDEISRNLLCSWVPKDELAQRWFPLPHPSKIKLLDQNPIDDFGVHRVAQAIKDNRLPYWQLSFRFTLIGNSTETLWISLGAHCGKYLNDPLTTTGDLIITGPIVTNCVK